MGASKIADSIRPGALLGGKYRVLRALGEGGMGKVVLARHEALEQDVAIKLLVGAFAFDPERVERFLREARAAAKLHSIHAVRVSDVGNFEAVCPYIVMEYLRGKDLDKLITERGPMPSTEAVDYLLEAIDAVAEAHSVGIVHRDLKPSNLFLARQADGSKIIKVLDFGISKQLSDKVDQRKLTADQVSLGTPAFTSPEQLKSAGDVDARTDIWSLGVVLYELLTAQLPFQGQTAREMLANILTEAPIPLSERLAHAPPGLEAVVRRCLERNRDARFASVAELADALAPLGSGKRVAEVQRATAILRGRHSELTTTKSSFPPPPPESEPGTENATVYAPARAPQADLHTQKSWGVGVALGPSRRKIALAVSAGIAGALVIIAVAFLALRGPAEPRAAAEVPVAAAEDSSATATPTSVPVATTATAPSPPESTLMPPTTPPTPQTRPPPPRPAPRPAASAPRHPAAPASASTPPPPTLTP